jgi:hypothetical protein
VADKASADKKADSRKSASARHGAGKAEATPSKRRRTGPLVSPYPVPPRELAGKWVAWSRYKIVASGDTLGEVMDSVASERIKGASYELLPSLSRGH